MIRVGQRPRWAVGATVLLVLAACAGLRADGPSRVTPVVEAYRKASPAVVNVSTRKVVRARMGLFGDELFDDIFPSPLTRRVPVSSLGSGVLIHETGYIATNAHVVRRAQQITVTLSDGRDLEGRVIGVEADKDLAIIKVDPNDGLDLPHLPLGRSDDLMVGETVIAIGNPLGYAGSLTTGVISALGRSLPLGRELEITGLIQIDAPINPGNSGGPLLNIRGELIGINTAIRADAQNIGFAIPADALADEVDNLLDFERINRVIFGARVMHRREGADASATVMAVRPGTPADGKLRVGDRIREINGRRVEGIVDFACWMLDAQPGREIRLRGRRGDKPLAVGLRLKAKPRPDGAKLAEGHFGLSLRTITPRLSRALRLPVERGLLVTGVEEGGPAHRVGIRPRDVLFQVGPSYVRSLEDLGSALEDLPGGGRVRVGILRRSVAAWVTLRARQAEGNRL